MDMSWRYPRLSLQLGAKISCLQVISEKQVPFSTRRGHLRLNKTLVQSYKWSSGIAPSRFKSSETRVVSPLWMEKIYCGAFQSLQLTTLSGWKENTGKTMGNNGKTMGKQRENVQNKMDTGNLLPCSSLISAIPLVPQNHRDLGPPGNTSAPCLFAQKMQSCQRAKLDPASTTDFDFPFIKCSTLSCQLPLDMIISIFILYIYPTVMSSFQSISRLASSGSSIICAHFQSFMLSS